MTDKQKLVNQAIQLTVLGHNVEHKRDIVRRMAEMGCEPTMEMFRAIDDFNLAKMAFDQLEQEHIILRNKLMTYLK